MSVVIVEDMELLVVVNVVLVMGDMYVMIGGEIECNGWLIIVNDEFDIEVFIVVLMFWFGFEDCFVVEMFVGEIFGWFGEFCCIGIM